MKTINFFANFLILLTTLFLTSFNQVRSQISESGTIVSDKITFSTDLRLKKKEKISVARYSCVIIKDLRPDNSKMGYVVPDSKKIPQKIVLPKEGEDYLNEIFNNAIQPLQDFDTLIIVLNELWFNETRTAATGVQKHVFGPERLVSSCYTNADFFVKKRSKFIHLGNFDSVATKKGEWLPNNCDKLLEKVARNLLLSADLLWSQVNEMIRTYPVDQFESLFIQRNQFPILKTDKPKKGIYFTYNDFLNNKPAEIDFNVTSERRKTPQFDGSNKEDTVWGYCDGENIFMHIGPGFYQLTKAQNTFEVKGPAVVEYVNTFLDKTIAATSSFYTMPIFAFESYLKEAKVSIEYYKYFRLNMKNGKLN